MVWIGGTRRVRRGPAYGYDPYRRRRGGGCLRDLLFLDAGCCIAEGLGCGPQLLLLTPALAKIAFQRGPGPGRAEQTIRLYQQRISARRTRPCCRMTPSCSHYALEALADLWHRTRRSACGCAIDALSPRRPVGTDAVPRRTKISGSDPCRQWSGTFGMRSRPHEISAGRLPRHQSEPRQSRRRSARRRRATRPAAAATRRGRGSPPRTPRASAGRGRAAGHRDALGSVATTGNPQLGVSLTPGGEGPFPQLDLAVVAGDDQRLPLGARRSRRAPPRRRSRTTARRRW